MKQTAVLAGLVRLVASLVGLVLLPDAASAITPVSRGA